MHILRECNFPTKIRLSTSASTLTGNLFPLCSNFSIPLKRIYYFLYNNKIVFVFAKKRNIYYYYILQQAICFCHIHMAASGNINTTNTIWDYPTFCDPSKCNIKSFTWCNSFVTHRAVTLLYCHFYFFH